MQIARSEAQLIVAGLESAASRMHQLEDSKSLTPEERESLTATIETTERAVALARGLFGGASLARSS